MNPTIIVQEKPGQALLQQKMVDTSNYPFTLNTNIGCLYGCSYCYLQTHPFNLHTEFGKEIKVKAWLPERLDLELSMKADLPQHLKRVQVNAATEGYLPQALHAFKTETGRDLMREILQVFQNHWDNDNRWMVHIVTKSHLIRRDLDLIAEMRNQVQIELTITTLDEEKARLLEGTAPTVAKRLLLIEDFAARGIFVRVMCMPFLGNEEEARETRQVLMNVGTQGFKHKGMNYWDEAELMKGNVVRKTGKRDLIFQELLLKSGESYPGDGSQRPIPLQMPIGKTKRFETKIMNHVDFGYRDINGENWGYVH